MRGEKSETKYSNIASSNKVQTFFMPIFIITEFINAQADQKLCKVCRQKSAKLRGFVLSWLIPYPPPNLGQKIRGDHN